VREEEKDTVRSGLLDKTKVFQIRPKGKKSEEEGEKGQGDPFRRAKVRSQVSQGYGMQKPGKMDKYLEKRCQKEEEQGEGKWSMLLGGVSRGERPPDIMFRKSFVRPGKGEKKMQRESGDLADYRRGGAPGAERSGRSRRKREGRIPKEVGVWIERRGPVREGASSRVRIIIASRGQRDFMGTILTWSGCASES